MSVDVVLMIVAGAILALGLVSSLLKRMWLSPSLLALAAGVVLGPEVLNVLEPETLGPENRVLEEFARVTLSISLVATGLQMTREDLRVNRSRAGLLLTAVMVGMWAVTSLGAHLLLGVEAWVALLIGAILTPTDPVVASSLVEGPLAEENLPRWLRRSLQLESGANDGLAVGFVLLPALVLAQPQDDGAAILGEIAKQVGLAVGIGLVVGWATARLVDVVEEHEDASTGFYLVSAVAMALLVLGTVHWLGGSGILASFVAGVTMSLTLREGRAKELEQIQSAVQKLVIVPIFLLFGALVPWGAWALLGWPGLAFALWTLVLRRTVPVALALGPTSTPRRGVAFLGWYGPLGVSAIYYALFVERYGLTDYERIFAACTLAIAVSVLVHPMSATPGVRAYAGRSMTATLRHPFRRGIDAAP
jgi:NhaP-type Na+/H+ or K+/H+ antiporter